MSPNATISCLALPGYRQSLLGNLGLSLVAHWATTFQSNLVSPALACISLGPLSSQKPNVYTSSGVDTLSKGYSLLLSGSPLNKLDM